MILSTWCELFSSKRKFPINELQCDKCGTVWEESSKIEKRFDKWNGHFCKTCLKSLHNEKLINCGKNALSKLSKEKRIINAKAGGMACQKSPNRDIDSFTKKRWNNMSEDERKNQVVNANNGLQQKLLDGEYRKKHFEKVFKGSKIGYISKGQKEVYNELAALNLDGFEIDGIVSSMKVDILNTNKKIAIEYNGDYYHCNPRKWNPEDYNVIIKMTAKEKWNLDRCRKFELMRLGYIIIVIWESDWKQNKEFLINKIKKVYYEIN